MCTSTIVLAVNGERVVVPASFSPSHRLIDVLRSETRFTGPKVGCGEGGCGACTVLADRFDPVTGAVSRATINSCLATIGSCNGASITTAEGLGNSKRGFHPVQEALAKHFASQCGYCTPGITVALAAAADRAAAAEPAAATVEAGGCDSARAAAIAAGLDGNLCRCTGWRPIIDAAREIADLEDLHKHACCCSSSSRCSKALRQQAPGTAGGRQHGSRRVQGPVAS
ncbi:hypothetical protein OEZ85_006766 [Tetradesmus obliquus]|uniref:2Fe-2S ferredoxin-type domain-containing protein n=1 Tax=Tetradesmus obliquus TaxID=3088 RepID=A0ABY8TWD5_TETOB|nr:hypothetical protein OEZ85_006766 [Tetradesmus obliquus]